MGEMMDANLEKAYAKQATDVTEVLTERGKRYGKFTDRAALTVALKRVIHDHWRNADATNVPDDVIESLHMICHKIGRIVNGDPNYADSWIDIAGYAKLVADRIEGIER